ncbi:hypothetical protein HP532_29370 [Pseudomonas sp. CrR25]|nr:hypothetical protein [Pseudomonas sp. CrR25]
MLRTALLFDGLASGAIGLLLVLAASWLGAFLELPRSLLLGAGFSLLPFAVALVWLANRVELSRLAVWAVIAVNAVWVVDSLLLLIAGWVAPNLFGYAFVIAQALAVLLFIELELMGLKRSQAALA